MGPLGGLLRKHGCAQAQEVAVTVKTRTQPCSLAAPAHPWLSRRGSTAPRGMGGRWHSGSPSQTWLRTAHQWCWIPTCHLVMLIQKRRRGKLGNASPTWGSPKPSPNQASAACLTPGQLPGTQIPHSICPCPCPISGTRLTLLYISYQEIICLF